MRVGVTGASGFVGRHVLKALAGRPDVETIAFSRTPIDDLPTGMTRRWCDIADCEPGIYNRLGSIDALFHLAWGGLPNYRSLHHFTDELPAQFRFLSRMIEEGLPTLLVTGTCYEYGMMDGEQCEDSLAPAANPYGYAKASLLRQLKFLKETIPFQLTWARLFYMYGAGQAATSLYPLLNEAVARGDATFPMSGGEQLRDYLHVEDVAQHLVALMDHPDAGVVNISSGVPISVRSLVEKWISESDWSIHPVLGVFPYPDYEPFAFWGSRTKLDRVLGSPPSHLPAQRR